MPIDPYFKITAFEIYAPFRLAGLKLTACANEKCWRVKFTNTAQGDQKREKL
jgi:hypothetical protein